VTFKDVFPDDLDVRWGHEYEDGRREFLLLSRFRQVHLDGTVDEIPAGFGSDGASIPRSLWRLESPYGPLLEPAIAHDYRYRLKIGKRKQADLYFREGMAVTAVAKWKRPLIYEGVRWFGGGGWGR
jgi:hypothetical protein